MNDEHFRLDDAACAFRIIVLLTSDMCNLRLLLIGFSLFVWSTILNGQTASEIISKSVGELGTLPPNDEAIAQAAAAKLDGMNPQDVVEALFVEALFLAMRRPQQVPNQKRTLNVIASHLRNFDIEMWLARLEAEAVPFMLNRGLRIADISTKSDSPRLKSFKLRLLGDKRVGQEVHGEARVHASQGLRICDIVMNSLWSKESETDRPPGFPVDAGSSLKRRDKLIAAYDREVRRAGKFLFR